MKKIFYNSIFIFFLTGSWVTYGQEEGSNLFSEPENTDQINAEAVRAAQKGKYDQAITKFKRIVSVQDQNVAATYNNLGYTYLLLGDYQNAIDSYRKAVERNPNLIPSLANLGKLLYQSGEFTEAIKYGERVISLDPQNTNVREWLPDAYKKAADKRMFELQQGKKTGKEDKADSDLNPEEAKKYAGEPDKKPPSKVEFIGGISTQGVKSNGHLTYYTPSAPIPFPFNLNAEVWASPNIKISAELTTPKPLLNIPTIMATEENLSFLLHKKEIYFGLGIHFAQGDFLRDSINNSGSFILNRDYPLRNDTKLGLIFGTQKEFNSFLIYTYPRYLFIDPKVNPQSIEFDRSITKVEYRMVFPEEKGRRFLPWHFELALGAFFNETFITEYNTTTLGTVGHYYGNYDLYADLSFGKIQALFNKVPFQLGFLFGSRFYFQDFNNTNPFGFGNGQGYFGFKYAVSLLPPALKITFPSLRAINFIMDIYSRQMLGNKIVLLEKIGFEFSDRTEPLNLFTADLGISYTF